MLCIGNVELNANVFKLKVDGETYHLSVSYSENYCLHIVRSSLQILSLTLTVLVFICITLRQDLLNFSYANFICFGRARAHHKGG